MTTPLGTFVVTDRRGRRVSVTRRTRETDIAVTLDLDGSGRAIGRHGDRLLRPPPDVLRPPRALRPGGPGRRRPRGRRAPHRRRRRHGPRPGPCRGAGRAGGDRPLRRGVGPDGRGPRDGGRRRRRTALRGDRRPVPRRARRRPPDPARRARPRRVLADGRRHAPRARHRAQRPPRCRGRVQGPGPGAAGRAWPSTPGAPASPRRRAVSGDPDRRRRLRRRQPREHRPGAARSRRRGRDRPSRRRRARGRRPHRPGRRGGRPGDGAPGAARISWPRSGLGRRGSPLPGHLPRDAAPLRGERTRMARGRWASCPGTRSVSSARRGCPTSAGTPCAGGATTRSSTASRRTPSSTSSTRSRHCPLGPRPRP